MGVLKKITKAILGNGSVTGVTPSITQGELNFEGGAAQLFQLQATKGPGPSATEGNSNPMDFWDIAQSHFFTVQIYSPSNPGYPHATGLHDKNGQPFSFCSGASEGGAVYKDYIPIKSMNFTYTSYDNMTLPVNIFGDFPLLHRKKMTTVSFSCYDMDQDVIELALKYWENQCFPENCVEYLDHIKATLKYRSYDVTGKLNFEKELAVIPTGQVSVSRSYEENAAKILNFSVVVVGATGASSKSRRAGSGYVIKERGYGDGNEYADLTYEKKVSLIYNTQGGIENQNEIYADDMR